MRISIDRDRCIGAGQCVLTLPGVFDQDETDGRVRLRTDTAPDTDDIHTAVNLCPTHALTVIDD